LAAAICLSTDVDVEDLDEVGCANFVPEAAVPPPLGKAPAGFLGAIVKPEIQSP